MNPGIYWLILDENNYAPVPIWIMCMEIMLAAISLDAIIVTVIDIFKNK